MFYEEKQINDVWFFRSSPESAWQPMDVKQLNTKATQLHWEVERAYQMLGTYGVSKDRARSLGNGIGVLVNRMDRDLESFKANYIPDAKRWLALRNCARITAMGSSGCEPGGEAYEGPTAHVTLNFWTHANEPETDTYSRRWLDKFVEKALLLPATKEEVAASVQCRKCFVMVQAKMPDMHGWEFTTLTAWRCPKCARETAGVQS